MLNNSVVKDRSGLEKIVPTIVSENDDDLTKVKKVFKWVQNNIKYIAMSEGLGGLVPNPADLTLERRYGDCKDMSTLTVELLNLAGVKAYRAWVGTRDIPYKYEEVPGPMIDNHMIAVYIDEKNDSVYYLDATDQYVEFGMPTAFIQGKQTLIDMGTTFQVKTIPIVESEKNTMNDTCTVYIDGNLLKGSGCIRLTGYFANNFKYSMRRSTDNEDVKNTIKSYTYKGSNRFLLLNHSVKLDENFTDINYEFELDKYIKLNNNEIYVNMNLDKYMEEYKALELDRKTDVEYEFCKSVKLYIKLIIPEGYSISYLPENTDFKSDYFNFHVNYNDRGNYVDYTMSMSLNALMLNKSGFESFNSFLKCIKSAYRENIILTKNL